LPVSLFRRFLPLLLTIVLAACQQGSNSHPVPSVSQVGSDIKCAAGDHAIEDIQAGWGFCYPGTWRYIEKQQASVSPPGLDLTFDITDIPCPTPTGSNSVQPICSPNAGIQVAFMIISTYERGNSSSLAAWLQTNVSATPTALQPIDWGNATEAASLADGRRIALTAHHVVVLDLRSGTGHLDLEALMSARLSTWKFTY
jgi:hypothetical protein